MATYSPKVYPIQHAQEIITEAMFGNRTVSVPLVRIEDNIKNQRALTSMTGDVTIQAYKSNPDETDMTDGIALGDAIMQPTKAMVLEKWDPETLRSTRFSEDMLAGAKNITSNRFEQEVIAFAVKRMGPAVEKRYWASITTATMTAIAALTTGTGAGQATTAEKAWAAAQTASLTDGVVARMIYDSLKLNTSAQIVGGASDVINVTGTTITASNIATEYAKAYAVIPDVLMQPEYFGDLKWFAPFSHKKFIQQLNIAQTYRDTFTVVGDKFYYLGIEIEFVPLPENVMTIGLSQEYVLGTDLTSDFTEFQTGPVKNYGDLQFMKAVFTLQSAVLNLSQKVLYL